MNFLKHITITLIAHLLLVTSFTTALYAQTSQPTAKIHTVKKGETVYSIATHYNTTVKDIYSFNPSATEGIKVGDNLRIVKPTSASYFSHTVAPKETLYSLSKTYGVTIEQILNANPGLSAENLKEGKFIAIPAVTKTHTVKAKETLYSIHKQYNIPIDDIYKANPGLKDGLKKDMTIVIPFAGNIAPVTTEAVKMSTKADFSTLKVGVLLPFLDKSEAQRSRFIEYYEGFLLAVEAMKAKGYSLDVYTFDIDSDAKLKALLESNDIKDLHLIVGGITPSQISALATFTKKNNIKYVIPFPQKESIDLGSNSFLVNRPQAELSEKVAGVYLNRFEGSNTIFLEEGASDNKADFVAELKRQLSSKNQRYQTTSLTLNLEDQLVPLLSTTSTNVIIPSSSTQQTLGKIIPVLKQIATKYPDIKVQLFGYPDWQAYPQLEGDFRTLEAVIYTPFFLNTEDSGVQTFIDKYKTTYGKSMINTYPKYAVFGYDTGLFFMNAMSRYGSKFDENISKMSAPTLQSVFHFAPEANSQEYINNGLYFVYYSKYDINKIDCSK